MVLPGWRSGADGAEPILAGQQHTGLFEDGNLGVNRGEEFGGIHGNSVIPQDESRGNCERYKIDVTGTVLS